jgi:hypothetical protein
VHSWLALGKLLALLEMFLGPRPLLGSREVKREESSLVERRLSRLCGCLRSSQTGQGLTEEEDLVLAGLFLPHTFSEVISRDFRDGLRGQGVPCAVLVKRFDALSPP